MPIIFGDYNLSAPAITTATIGGGQVTLSFSAPVYQEGLPITQYVVTATPGNFSAVGSASPITVTGLTNGTAYTFAVTAYNLAGAGPASSTSSYTPNLISFNGFNTPAAMNGSTSADYMRGVTVNSAGRFVAVGYDTNDYPLYATSTNGSTWTTPATMNGSTTVAFMTGVTVNSAGLFVAVGYNSSNYPVYATSTDGSTWTTPATMNGSTTVAEMYGVTVNSAGRFVAVGKNSNSYPVYATSTNGSTWTTPATMNGSTTVAYMIGVTVNSAGRFVAVGYNTGESPIYASSN